MKPRTCARRPSSIGSNQLSKSRSSASPARAVVVLLVMAWSPVRRSNAGISRVANPGDYATLIPTTSATAPLEGGAVALAERGEALQCVRREGRTGIGGRFLDQAIQRV